MVDRSFWKCAGCSTSFVLRVSWAYNVDHLFRFNCPSCKSELDGQLVINFRTTDGTLLPPERWDTFLRIEGAQKLTESQVVFNEQTAWITIFSDLPIDAAHHVQRGKDVPLYGPTMFTMACLDKKVFEYGKRTEHIYSLPENDIKVLKSAFNAFKRKDLENAKSLLDKVSFSVPKKSHHVASICGITYSSILIPFVGPFVHSGIYLEFIDKMLSLDKMNTFVIPKQLIDSGRFESILNLHFELLGSLIDNKLILSIALFIDMCPEAVRESLVITANYPELVLRIYEQLCEANHTFVKIFVGLMNIVNRGGIHRFNRTNIKDFGTFFERATISTSLDLVTEHPGIGEYFNTNLDRKIRNAIAHRSVQFTPNGQTLNSTFSGEKYSIDYPTFLMKLLGLSQSILFFTAVLTDMNRIVTDIASNGG